MAEITSVLDLIDEASRVPQPRPSVAQLQAVYEALQSTGGVCLGAVAENNLVGTCTVAICPNFSWSARPYAVIENVVVTQRWRQQGVGTQLLRAAVEWGKSAGCYKVVVMTGSTKPSTLRFYESAGFEGSKTGFQVRFE